MTAPVIMQGSQFYLPITITAGTTAITNENCDDIKIKLHNVELKASEGEIEYGSFTLLGTTYSGWLFPLTQELTLAIKSSAVPVQAEIRIGSSILPTPVVLVDINTSIITGVW